MLCVCLLQGEEGPPSLEYIQARDLFPQKDLVKEDDTLQVSSTHGSADVTVSLLVPIRHTLFSISSGNLTDHRAKSSVPCHIDLKTFIVSLDTFGSL